MLAWEATITKLIEAGGDIFSHKPNGEREDEEYAEDEFEEEEL